MQNTYCSLHNHTYASNIRFLDSINRPEDMIHKAIELGLTGIAFTDHESLSAAVSILKIRDDIKKDHPDFKIIFGNEIYLIDASKVHNTKNYYHFILLAKDAVGWDQLRRLSSRAWDRGYMDRGIMRVPTTQQDIQEIVGNNPGHIYGMTACIGGQFAKMILANDKIGAIGFVDWCSGVFGKENFALELQPSDSEEQKIVNAAAIQIAKSRNLPFVVTTDSHYLNEEDFPIQAAFLSSKKANDREAEKFYKFTFLMEPEKIKSILAGGGMSEEDIDTAFQNTIKIGNQIQEFDFRHTTIVPKIAIPAFKFRGILAPYSDRHASIKLFLSSSDEQDRFLMYQIEQGILDKHVALDETKLDRINTELDVLSVISDHLKQRLSAYLNLTADIINLAWKVSLCGPGRGSACGFYINYLIGITQVDPLVYGLPYWRFLNKERIELPDVDSDFQPEKTADIISLLKQKYGEDNVLNCATFRTESLKAAILSVGRGLGFNNDDMQALAALVPSHRGLTYSLQDCLEGNEEQGFDPVPNFAEKFRPYPGLLEGVRKIEGLPTNASIHASALYIFNNGYLSQNSLMRAPNGTKITAFTMHDSDDLGALKMDVLRTEAQSKIAKCLSLLLTNNEIQWQGSLRETYNKYLHPDVLDYDNSDMWEKAANGQITNLFQFDTQVGSVCIKKAQPTNVVQLAEINSIMRLQTEGTEQPIDRYVRFRNNIDLWYLEMAEEELEPQEIKILEKYLLKSYGVSGSQEVLMQLLMDPNISNFTLGEANAARKYIAKKQLDKIATLKEDFYNKGRKARTPFLNYVWKYCIEPQTGYSFSLNHTLPYSVVSVQEMNLFTKFNPLYWQCACLCVNAGNFSTNLDDASYVEEEIADDIECRESDDSESDETGTVISRSAPDYSKIAKALDEAQHTGIKIDLPDINLASLDFVPDLNDNSIMYSLSAINVVNDALANLIISHRPYISLEQFYQVVQPTTVQMIGLIKAGCFDQLLSQSRFSIMHLFLSMLSTRECPLKTKITSVHIDKALDMGLDLSDYRIPIRLYRFRKYIRQHDYDTNNKRFILQEEGCVSFFKQYLMESLDIVKGDYGYLPNSAIFVKESAFNKIYDVLTKELFAYLNSDDGRNTYCQFEKKAFETDLWNKYCLGSLSTWEMDTMCFYYSGHELQQINDARYRIADFNQLAENPSIRSYTDTKGVAHNSYNTVALAGTVIKADNTKHLVSISTVNGVVGVKFYISAYTLYNQKVSVIDKSEGKQKGSQQKKTVLDESWFKRGQKILVYGYRKENTFIAKSNYDYGYSRMVGLIERINQDGSIEVRFQREKTRGD